MVEILKHLAKQILETALRFLVKVNGRKIVFLYANYSGSNSIALYKLASPEIRERYQLILLKLPSLNSKMGFIEKLNRFFKLRSVVFSARVIISTHFQCLKGRKSISLEAWHGFPLKAMGLMDIGEKDNCQNVLFDKADFILSYSPFYNTLLNACIGSSVAKYVCTGMPRNDFLFKSNGKRVLEKVIGEKLNNKKIIFYLPTFREGYKNRIEGEQLSYNIFRFSGFSWSIFQKFLNMNSIKFVLKIHPNEVMLLSRLVGRISPEIVLLTEELLERKSVDLYEFLNAADVLITDYSSVYFDYLLLDRPIVFIPIDLEIYRKKRGLLLEPYDFWTPGPKVYTYEELEKEIITSLNNGNYYREQRKVIQDIVHLYKDGESCKRIWNFINEIMSKRDNELTVLP